MPRRAIVAEDLYDLAGVGDPRVSPDGKMVAYVRQTLDRDENETRTEVWVADVDGGGPRRLTAGKKDRDPRWAPDCRRLAFVSDRTGKRQIHILDVRGGEAWTLETEGAVESPPVWSPDGTRIAFISRSMDRGDDWRPYPGCPDNDRDRAERAAEAQLKAAGEGKNGGKKDHLSGVKVITQSVYRFDGMGYFGDLNRHVFCVDVPPVPDGTRPAARQLTRGPHNHGDPTWSPDGRFVAVTALRREPDYDDLFKTDIWRVELATGAMDQVVDAMGPAVGLTWAPCGRYLAYVGHHGEHGRSTSPGLWLVPVDDPGRFPLGPGDLTCPTRDLDRPVGFGIPSDVRCAGGAGLDWDRDEGRIYFLLGDSGSTWIYESHVEDGVWSTPGPVAGDETGAIVALSAGPAGLLAYQRGRADAPDHILARGSGGDERQLTSENAAVLGRVRVSTPRQVRFQAPDGWDIEGWLYCPPDMKDGEQGPLVLMIHGGPHGAYGHGFNFLTQYLAGQGFMVLMLNPRGSQTYGQEFASAVVGDWGGKDYHDLMAGVDHVIELGLADPERLGVTGWSYGGYMTNWVIGQTGRFRAAITGACVFNHLNFYGTSDIGPTFGEFQWGGNPWENPDRLLERSPLKHVGEVETPVLILHGEADLRCPVEQGEQLFAALKRRGKTAVMVRYPGEFHGLAKPAHRVDRCQRTAAWFRHHLK